MYATKMSRSESRVNYSVESVRPKVSVIIAAYNSSNRLKCAVTSVLQQTFSDVEVVVVGDCCTDDSAEVLRSMEDPRIRWENLPRNWGEQSVASNRGIELSRGDYIFFLNQDDLWLTNHVSDCLLLLDSQRRDVVWSPYVIIPPESRPGRSIGALPYLAGVSRKHPHFDPGTFIPASCTAWRASALRKLGGWRTAGEVAVSPSQDLLWRACRQRLSIVGKPTASVLVLWSGHRPGSYLPSFDAIDNEHWLNAILSNPDVVEQEVLDSADRVIPSQANRWGKVRLRRMASLVVGNFVGATGRHPRSIQTWMSHRKTGGFINAARALNNLDKRDFRNGLAKPDEQ